MEKHLVMYLIRKSIMLLRKYLLVTEFQVSKCGSHIVKIRKDVLYPKRTKYSKYSKCRCSRGRLASFHSLLKSGNPKVPCHPSEERQKDRKQQWDGAYLAS